MKPQLPNIYDYNDFRKYLADYQTARAEYDRSYSKAGICKKIGIPNSRSYFSDVLNGKTVTSVYVERFVQAMELAREEAQFFRALVRYNQADNENERELFFDQLIGLNRTPKIVLERKAFPFFREWRHSAIRALLDVIDLRDDYRALGEALLPPVSAKQAQESVELLSSLDLIRRNDQGFWKPTEKSLLTSEYVRDEMVKQCQLQCLELARKALLGRRPQVQDISTNMVSVSEEGFRRIQRHVQRFRSEIRSLVHKDGNPADRVYLLNIQLVPTARPRSRKKGAEAGKEP